MSLEVDIQLGNQFEKQALATAAALDKIAVSEKTVNALAQKLGVSSKQVGAAEKHMANERKTQEKKAADDQKKRKDGEAAFRDKIKAGAAAWFLFKDAASAAKDVVADIAKSVLEASYNASQTKREATAMIGAFTGGHAKEFMLSLDKLAGQLGNTVDETRSQFVEFRKTGMSNDLSFKLIKARADMIAVGLSAKEADAQIAYVTASGRDLGTAYAHLRVIKQHFEGVGEGATAAAYATVSLSAAQNKISTAVSQKLADLWTEVGPEIGKAAHRMADFTLELLKSKEGEEMIKGVTEAFKDMAKAINKENLMTALNAILSVATAIGTVFKGVDAVFSGKIGESAAQLIGAYDTNNANAEQLNRKRAELAGGAVGEGLAKGIAESAGAAATESQRMADSVLAATAAKLEIRSPSKAFARMGKQTVQGFEQGQEQALGRDMPIDAAVEPPQVLKLPAPQQSAPATAPAGDRDGKGGFSIVIENLNVTGGGTADENARSIRQELQLLLTAGNISRGLASV